MQKNKGNGSAILTSLFIMILVAIAATAMSLRLQIDINRTQLIQDVGELKTAAQAGELSMINQLIKNGLTFVKASKQNIDPKKLRFTQPWLKGISVQTDLIDLQSRLNLNNLKNTNQLKSLTLLMTHLIPKQSPQNAFLLALQTQEWLTKKNPNVTNVSSENYYQHQTPPYYPSHKPFTSISEWRLVKGITQTVYNRISPYVASLPKSTPINLNSASKEIIRSLKINMNDTQVSAIVKARGKQGFRTLKEALENPLIKALGLKEKETTLTSNYFLIMSHASSQDIDITLFTVIKREITKEGVGISVIQQTLNTL